MFKTSDTPENQVEIRLFGPMDAQFKDISEEVAGNKRWKKKTSDDIVQQYEYERAALMAVNNIHINSLRNPSDMPVNVLILAKMRADTGETTRREVVYCFKKTSNPAQDSSVPDCLAQFELRHATDEGLCEIINSLARALTPTGSLGKR